MKALYFGCRYTTGHGFYLPDGSRPRTERSDATDICPWGYHVDSQDFVKSVQDVPEGAAVVHHKDGWSALAFPDRSIDSRGGSISVFMFDMPGLDFDQLLYQARFHFPGIFTRYDFEIAQAAA